MPLTLPLTLRVTPDQFWQICQANPDATLELNAQGEIETISPTGWQSGQRNATITARLTIWVRATGMGAAFDSSTGFRLPNGAVRSPDAAWVSAEKMAQVSNAEPDQFFPGCPDFVIELASASDDVSSLRGKMREYQENGVLLGWLIIPQLQQVEIFRPGQTVEVLSVPKQVVADDLMPGFVLPTAALWEQRES
jgi:Uma2 family endonuclease